MNNLDYLSVASEIAREAGHLLLGYRERSVEVEYKGAFDLVTAADRASEKFIVERLRTRFPSHAIVAEEGGGVEGDSGYVWYVDPLDGTTNFAHGQPAFCVSIGLEREDERIVGVVYDPVRDDLFAAERGAGAYLNNRRVRASKIGEFRRGLFGTGFPSANRHGDVNVYYFHQVSMLSHGVRRSGSAALDLCSLACGRLEGFWEFGLKSWDVSAGLAIVEEAGGKVTDMKGGPYRSGDPHLATSNGALHEAFVELLDDVSAGRYRVPIPPIVKL